MKILLGQFAVFKDLSPRAAQFEAYLDRFCFSGKPHTPSKSQERVRVRIYVRDYFYKGLFELAAQSITNKRDLNALVNEILQAGERA
ncbi:MAG: hypothetical protein ACTTIC_04435 [Helicobacteraceae bacterium]